MAPRSANGCIRRPYGDPVRVLASGVAFGWAHVVVHDATAMALATIGGVLFASTYERHRSTLLVALEHALYGDFVLTIGPGQYGDPVLSSTAVTFLGATDPPPYNPGGPRQLYRFLARALGTAEISIPHVGGLDARPPFALTIGVH